jgi:hypothetical protein
VSRVSLCSCVLSIHIYKCVYVCMYVCMYVCVCVSRIFFRHEEVLRKAERSKCAIYLSVRRGFFLCVVCPCVLVFFPFIYIYECVYVCMYVCMYAYIMSFRIFFINQQHNIMLS